LISASYELTTDFSANDDTTYIAELWNACFPPRSTGQASDTIDNVKLLSLLELDFQRSL
jgi:hypothetical protein